MTLGALALDGSDVRRVKPLLLLAYLAIEGARERRHLAGLFWMGAADPLNSLSKAINQLNKEAPGVLAADALEVQATVEADAAQLLTAVDQGDDEDVLGLYQGPFLKGVYLKDWSSELEEWIYGTRELIAHQVQETLLELAETEAGSGDFEGAARRAERAYLLPGAPEPPLETLERLYALLVAGGSARAGEVKAEAESFGVPLALTPGKAREDLARASSQGISVRYNLPAQATAFVGRTEELEQVKGHLQDPDSRLVTITGPGGMGKTRLAIEAARAHLGAFDDGVFFVPFAAVSSPDGMVSVIREALGLPDPGPSDPKEQLFEHLTNRSLLLVLDNLEHLLEGTGFIRELWERFPGVQLLLTSREPLKLRAERVLRLSGMSAPEGVPAEAWEAVELFLNTARSTGYRLVLDEENAIAIARVCRLVGGLPLAIELAASWVRALPIEEIAREIERGIDLLEAAARDVPERHRSVRAVFDHSWQLLTGRERETLARLSVFQGGFRREAAAEVAGATLPVLTGLLDKSLLRMGPGGRYDRHPLLYQYTQEKLSEHPEEQSKTQAKHGRYYLRKVAERLGNPKDLQEELPNIRVAWDWAVVNQEHGLIERAAWPLTTAFESRNREAIAMFSRAAANLDEFDPAHVRALAQVLFGEAYHLTSLAFYTQAEALGRRGLEFARAAGDKAGIMRGLALSTDMVAPNALEVLHEGLALAREVGGPRDIGFFLAHILLCERHRSDLPEFRRIGREILTELRESGDDRHVVFGLVVFGAGLVYHDALDKGQELLEESLRLSRELGLRAEIPMIRCELALVAHKRGRFDQAKDLYLEAADRAREINQQLYVAKALGGVGRVALALGDLSDAERHLQRSLEMFGPRNVRGFIQETLVLFGELLSALGVGERAAELLFMVRDGLRVEKRDRDEAERQLVALREQLSPEELARARDRARSMKLEEVVKDLLGPS